MIVKKSHAKKVKSKGQHIYDLYHYINKTFDIDSEEKVAQSGTLNMGGTDDSAIILEMETLASKCIRAKNPVEHWILSLNEGEHFSPENTKDVVGMFLDGLGY